MRNWIVLTVVACGVVVGGFTFWPRSGPATPLGAAVGSTLSALDMHMTTPINGLPVQAYDAY